MTRSSYRAWCGVIGRVLPKPAALMREALSETLPVRIATGEIRAYLPVSSDEGMAAGSGTSLARQVADRVWINSRFRRHFQWICNFWIPRRQGGIILGLQSNCGHPIDINICPFHAKLCDSVGKWPVAILTGHILHFTWSRTRRYLFMWA